ncbi:MAG: hypothetical protein QMB52_08675 [Propionivibrio sp.]
MGKRGKSERGIGDFVTLLLQEYVGSGTSAGIGFQALQVRKSLAECGSLADGAQAAVIESSNDTSLNPNCEKAGHGV